MPTFSELIAIAELGDLVLDGLPLPGLTAFAFTSRANYLRVQDYIRSKFRRLFTPFKIGLKSMMTILRFTGSIIVGSVALKAVAPADAPIHPGGLDLVVPMGQLSSLESWLAKLKYEYLAERPLAPNSRRAIPYATRFSYARRQGDRVSHVHIYAVHKQTAVYEFIFYGSNTSTMNYISYNGLYSAYRSLLDQGLAAKNHTTNMIPYFFIARAALSEQNALDDANNLKAIQRGFQMIAPVPSAPTGHTYSKCECVHLAACPCTIRHTHDLSGAYLRFMNGGEYRSFKYESDSLPRTHTKPPITFWKLADVQGSSRGFAFLLTERRLFNMLHEIRLP